MIAEAAIQALPTHGVYSPTPILRIHLRAGRYEAARQVLHRLIAEAWLGNAELRALAVRDFDALIQEATHGV